MKNRLLNDKKKKKLEDIPSDFRTYDKTTEIKMVWSWRNSGQIVQSNRTEPKCSPTYTWSIDFK